MCKRFYIKVLKVFSALFKFFIHFTLFEIQIFLFSAMMTDISANFNYVKSFEVVKVISVPTYFQLFP